MGPIASFDFLKRVCLPCFEMKEAEILKTDNQTKCDSNVCEVGWEEGDEDNDEKKGNDEKMHCIGSLVMPPSANLVNARISHQQHSTPAAVRLRCNR